jgi:hypothetical protein
MALGLHPPILCTIHPQVLKRLVIIVIHATSYGHIQSDILGDAVLTASRFSMARSRSALARLLKTPINHLVEYKKSHFYEPIRPFTIPTTCAILALVGFQRHPLTREHIFPRNS